LSIKIRLVRPSKGLKTSENALRHCLAHLRGLPFLTLGWQQGIQPLRNFFAVVGGFLLIVHGQDCGGWEWDIITQRAGSSGFSVSLGISLTNSQQQCYGGGN